MTCHKDLWIYGQYSKKRVSQLQNELMKKDATTEYWSNQITPFSNNEPHTVDENTAFNESITSIINNEIV